MVEAPLPIATVPPDKIFFKSAHSLLQPLVRQAAALRKRTIALWNFVINSSRPTRML